MNSQKRMAVNTVILYVKLIVTIVVNLISTRIILNAMGVEDYGIVNLISGIVAMLSFIQNSMSVSSQRYLSFTMGKHNFEQIIEVFNSSYFLHILLGCFLFITLEALVPIIFDSSIQIPEARIHSAKILYQLTVIGTCLVIITVPYDALLNAHENMLTFSIVSIIESFIRLAGAFILIGYGHDKLIFYGFLLVFIRTLSMIIKQIYCLKHYPECKIKPRFLKKKLMKEMFSFAFWNMFGALALTGRNQGVAVVMNLFLGVIVNAAYGIANQIMGQLNNFTATISKAMNPQIMQKAGAGDNEGMIRLALKQSKYSSILLSYAVLPLFFSMPFILKIWLKVVPEYCIDFCRLILFVSLFQQLSAGMMSMVQANGKIRTYQIIISLILLLNIPTSYFMLKAGATPPFVILSMIVIEMFVCIARVCFAINIVGLKLYDFICLLLIPILFLYGFSGIILYFLNNQIIQTIQNELFGFITFFIFSIIVTTISVMLILNKNEKVIIKGAISKRFRKR